MCSSSYPLISFSPLSSRGLSLHGTVRRDVAALHLEFVLAGDLAQLEIAAPGPLPQRTDGLWRTTCFECFFRLAGIPGYYEVNLAPTGDWNYYYFSGYRQGMDEVAVGTPILTSQKRYGEAVTLTGRVPLGAGIDTLSLELAFGSVLAHRNGELSYWALVHPGERPDFHHPDGFVVKL